ncbi:putative polyketide synthase [Aspergillus indologenus CBS 114.80]|uniref:Putative polyketide synthase n=1 Tax=Aspergillus indologenus CBS 114.80 TaxID=1450541 RepID=A0A2V5IB39_9EURO|nr:putative polyketide synthase [Aspergillus indologenus CBS 114.80]
MSGSKPAVLLFGSLSLSFDEDAFQQLQRVIIPDGRHHWAWETLTCLPQSYHTIVAAIPALESAPTLKHLHDLKDAVQLQQPLTASFPLPNSVLIPLVVVFQLTQYADMIEDATIDLDPRVDLFTASIYGQETLGFCTGLLSAIAVSSARTKQQFCHFAAVAARLGLLVGMVVDACDATSSLGPSQSLIAAWSSSEKEQELRQILQAFPEAYLSVYYDEDRATVTTAASTLSPLLEQCRATGILAAEVGLYGRFHSDAHSKLLPAILDFCDAHLSFQFPDATKLVIPTRSNAGGSFIQQGLLHHHALQQILIDPPQWFTTVDTVRKSRLQEKDARVVSFGTERCIPPSLMRTVGQKAIQAPVPGSSKTVSYTYSGNDIAVVGMACKTAGADNLEEFWDLLCAGKSQHKEVPKERFGFETVFRDADHKRKWFGNFINGYDEFDHKFFKKSPRESATMDPQQRHLLQIAYQTVEQSGYFHNPSPDKRIGCYIGVCACDYEANIACHAPNAFSATGNLQGFIAGKVSHFFGWTGPGLTIDTACSSSAVAVHQACRAIVGGECSAALAGGTHVMTNPLWFQNLAGASFLSPTGQCKPFDIKADGYCRGEGIATIFLKRLSAAVADGDQIMGVIPATAVQQNQDCTPIFVPNVPSLSDLFQLVSKQARLTPAEISVVEAHGTGTAVGDPAEYDSVRAVLGRSIRKKPLMLSSVKGLVGHVECTSGIISIIKVLLMIQKSMIPPQASFTTINPAIKATSADNIVIPTSLQQWDATFKAALINNYGASGSNASLIITQAPTRARAIGTTVHDTSMKYPFRLTGFDDHSLQRYSKALRNYLTRDHPELNLADIAFNAARQRNWHLDRTLIFSVKSIDKLNKSLQACEDGDSNITSISLPSSRSVVLCFGGQVSKFVGLDRQVYEHVAVFRKHLNTVDAVAQATGVGCIFPDIFSRASIDDPVKLQVMLFSMQYASARSWIDSGIQPAAVVGHSFGELTALCVAGALPLEDSMRMIVARATIIKDFWGPDKGAMIAVEAELHEVEALLVESKARCASVEPATIACYNGPRSYTLAGATPAVQAVIETLASTAFSSMRHKRLNVTNSFHCSLLDPLLERLEQSAQSFVFNDPAIPVERATESSVKERLTPQFVAHHIRSPVFFHQAIKRLDCRYPSCIFLEAGSNSTVANMASRALGSPESSHFQSINISCDNGWNNLVDATMNLWKAGLGVQFWAHQSSQSKEHTILFLPPYQFERSKHWIELKTPPRMISEENTRTETKEQDLPEKLFKFVGYQDSAGRQARFRLNTLSAEYDRLIRGHVIAQTAPICPATIQLDIVIEAVRSTKPEFSSSKLEPRLYNVENASPLCINRGRAVWVEAVADDNAATTWNFQVFSNDLQDEAPRTVHTTGQIVFQSVDDLALKLEFARLERHFSHEHCLNILRSSDPDEVLQSRNIYKIFAEIVDYGEEYRGLQKLVSKGNQSAGLVAKKYNPESWLDGHLADGFCQVGGIYVNCMVDRTISDMYIANGVEQWIRSPRLHQQDPRPDSYHVLATHHRPSAKAFLTDVFVFDPTNGSLIEAILGISYVKVPKASISRLLSRLTEGDFQVAQASTSEAFQGDSDEEKISPPAVPQVQIQTSCSPPSTETQAPGKGDIAPKVKAILTELSGLELEEIKDDSNLADLGIDSLMGMELAHEIEAAFQITIPENELMDVIDIPSLMKCVQAAIGGGVVTATESSDQSTSESEESDAKPSGYTTPSTVSELAEPAKSGQNTGLNLPFAAVMEAFNEVKSNTDNQILEYKQANYFKTVLPLQDQLCVSLVLEAFDKLGQHIRNANPGDKFVRVEHAREHTRLVDYLYRMLDEGAGLVNIDGDGITRTAVLPPRTSSEILAELVARFPDQSMADELTFYTGSQLAEVLKGRTDGIKLIFGTAEGRDLVSKMYAEWPLNRLFYRQMEEFISRLVSKVDMTQGAIKILEMGAGTGGTTRWLVPLLAELNIPVEYTFTDLAPSFVAAARKRFGKQYPFMKFRTHDIEKAPTDDLLDTQHIIIASNAVHATHSLRVSASHIRKALRPDGVLMMLEMTSTMYWVDITFGLFEGWWYFDDERTHAVTHESQWETELHSAGYGHVDWTNGARPENRLEKLIVAFASGGRYERLPQSHPIKSLSTDCAARQTVIYRYLREMTAGWEAPSVKVGPTNRDRKCVVLTGATGSLGSHVVQKLASSPGVTNIICLNRRSRLDADQRQLQSLSHKGIWLPDDVIDKLTIMDADLTRPQLGLSSQQYETLVSTTTHIIHNAWLMNAKWPLDRFKSQLCIMRNLLDFASAVVSHGCNIVTFQFISSIATVGHYPLYTGRARVPEAMMGIESVLPTGYGDAKYICELMLESTLRLHPDKFYAMTVRPGQIAGSSESGYWNPREHFSFLIKSSQTLGALPRFEGLLSWTPVDVVAGTLVDLLLRDDQPYPVYHIENPIRQRWEQMMPVLADELHIPQTNTIPFSEWVQRVRDYSLQAGSERDNPAIMLADFLDENFLRMSCGGLLLETRRCREHSKTLADMGPVSEDVTRLYIKTWRTVGFLS